MSSSPSLAGDSAAAEPKRIEFDDPHAGTANLQEAEVTRVRVLRGGWRWALIIATAATILLCINQQFSLRFFVGYTQLNTEYFYLLIALMLPFTFLIFPGTETSPLDRIPWYDVLLFVITIGASIELMMHVRKAAEAGWEFGGAPTNVIAAGLLMWAVLMEALRRTGGWSLLLSVFPFTVYPLRSLDATTICGVRYSQTLAASFAICSLTCLSFAVCSSVVEDCSASFTHWVTCGLL